MKDAKSSLFGYASIGIVALVTKTQNQAKRKKSTTDLHQESVVLFFLGGGLDIDILISGASGSEIFAVFPHKGNIPYRNANFAATSMAF